MTLSIRMLHADLRHFLDPIQQIYGYLYHFLNAVALTFLRPINHFVGLSPTKFDILVLRELSAIYYLVPLIALAFFLPVAANLAGWQKVLLGLAIPVMT